MELTIAQKLDLLLKLQQTDSQLDDIKKIRGDLPEEVRDLEDEIIGFETRINKFQSDIESLDDEVNGLRLTKKESEKLIGRYKDQQMNVRNNREFDAISKEIELQGLEMELADKKIREAEARIKLKKDEIAGIDAILTDRREDLMIKKQDLDTLITESEEDEKKLIDEHAKQAVKIEERLYKSYMKLRNNSGNGLAVVKVQRGACGGCFNIVPPQRQADIREKKKLIVCEHCGRVLADVD